MREGAPVDAERLEPLHFVGLSREPCEGRPLDEVIEREQAAHQNLRRRVLRATVPHVRDAQRPIGGFAGEEDGARAAEKMAPLRPRKDAGMQDDQRDPFGLAAGPSEGCELAGAVLQRRDRDGARCRLGVARRHPVTSARSPRKYVMRIPIGFTIISSGSTVSK